MGLVTIAFIPEEQDYVWKISSQKVPHMTFLFLGEINDEAAVSRIVKYVDHTNATSLHRFGMSVDRRGELGAPHAPTADVLFFEDHNKKWLEEIRTYLLQNVDIFKAYNSVEQFPKWIPHLTLGYPDDPANEIERDFGIHWVEFDRIAVWTDEFDGPEFILPKNNDLPMAWSSDLRSFMSHHGVKGMKWGVRKRSGGVSKTRTSFKKSPKKLSDAELNKRIKRMETEKKYNSLNKKDVSGGRKAAEEILSGSGKRVLKTLAATAGTVAVKKLLEAHFSSEIAKEVAKRL